MLISIDFRKRVARILDEINDPEGVSVKLEEIDGQLHFIFSEALASPSSAEKQNLVKEEKRTLADNTSSSPYSPYHPSNNFWTAYSHREMRSINEIEDIDSILKHYQHD